MAIKLAIIHFQPLELYPPAMNTISYLENTLPPGTIDVYTTTSIRSLFTFKPASPRTRIKRLARLSAGRGRLLASYISFYTKCIIFLVLRRPSVVLYFETISALPVILYKRFVNRRASVMVHYHEYTSLEEYRRGMKLNRWFHKMETGHYNKFDWISHMIRERMDLFLSDHSNVDQGITHLLPNFPPSFWKRERPGTLDYPLKVIYVGSLSMETMFVKEFAQWLHDQQGKVSWDIYAFNFETPVKDFLTRLASPFIRFMNGIGYYDLPSTLERYDVGVILYKGTIPNYVFNAPNKLFEYLSGGLDVWFPDVMTGSLPFKRTDVYPKVIPLNFEALDRADLDTLVSRVGVPYVATEYYSETVLPRLGNAIRLFHERQF